MSPDYVIFASYGNDSIALIQWAFEHRLQNVVVAYNDTELCSGQKGRNPKIRLSGVMAGGVEAEPWLHGSRTSLTVGAVKSHAWG